MINANITSCPIDNNTTMGQTGNVAKPNNKTTKTIPRGSGTVGTTLNVPVALWKRLRNHSTEARVSQQEIWLAALAEYLNERRAA